MPTTTHPHIYVRARVVHNRYGRGVVESVLRERGLANVLFHGEETARYVLLKHLALEPADMPKGVAEPMAFVRAPYRVVWPLDRVAGEGEVS
jgi:hypothetical protein